jgi:hypothetical protein
MAEIPILKGEHIPESKNNPKNPEQAKLDLAINAASSMGFIAKVADAATGGKKGEELSRAIDEAQNKYDIAESIKNKELDNAGAIDITDPRTQSELLQEYHEQFNEASTDIPKDFIPPQQNILNADKDPEYDRYLVAKENFDEIKKSLEYYAPNTSNYYHSGDYEEYLKELYSNSSEYNFAKSEFDEAKSAYIDRHNNDKVDKKAAEQLNLPLDEYNQLSFDSEEEVKDKINEIINNINSLPDITIEEKKYLERLASDNTLTVNKDELLRSDSSLIRNTAILIEEDGKVTKDITKIKEFISNTSALLGQETIKIDDNIVDLEYKAFKEEGDKIQREEDELVAVQVEKERVLLEERSAIYEKNQEIQSLTDSQILNLSKSLPVIDDEVYGSAVKSIIDYLEDPYSNHTTIDSVQISDVVDDFKDMGVIVEDSDTYSINELVNRIIDKY